MPSLIAYLCLIQGVFLIAVSAQLSTATCNANADCSIVNCQMVCTCKQGFTKNAQNQCVPVDDPCSSPQCRNCTMPTTANPSSCPSDKILFRNECVEQCPIYFVPEAFWQYSNFSTQIGKNCYFPFPGVGGTRVQVNVTQIANNNCGNGCADMAITFTDNMQPANGPVYCCSSNYPSFTSTTTNAMLIIHYSKDFATKVTQARRGLYLKIAYRLSI
uniref:Uncharacterized protein n=1 Tax=Plectus sambesii TaxID=2011161 RepID=A0A914UIX9_9BILA